MNPEDRDPVRRWQSISDWYAEFAAQPHWEFLAPMVGTNGRPYRVGRRAAIRRPTVPRHVAAVADAKESEGGTRHGLRPCASFRPSSIARRGAGYTGYKAQRGTRLFDWHRSPV
jgi:hypothetical protein